MAQHTQPLIGINADYVPESKHSSAHIRLRAGYGDSMLTAGAVPVVMPPMNKEAEINAFLDHVDGFMLTAGGDMDPRRSGQPYHHAVRPMPERREANDRMLVRCILKRRIPLLAIGLGMQQLNAALGGTLYMHLPEDKPRSLPHHNRCPDEPHRHLVLLQSGSRLEEIYGGEELLVNSDHHQAVNEVGEGLNIAARAPDGVIEAVEGVDPTWFCVGVQWHPDSGASSALDLQLFECFVQACLCREESLQLAA